MIVEIRSDKVTIVTPFTGVWIEILLINPNSTRAAASLPSRECGLKLYNFPSLPPANWCHSLHGSVDWNTVLSCGQLRLTHMSLPSRECGLKFFPFLFFPGIRNRHSLHGSVDWNWFVINIVNAKTLSLPSRECGLKSLIICMMLMVQIVTPFTGVWIEISWHL